MNIAELFPVADFRHQMGLKKGVEAEFFRPTSVGITEERRQLLRAKPGTYSALLPGAEVLLDECIGLAREWESISETEFCELRGIENHKARCIRFGEIWEPDFLLLDGTGEFQLVGGCVCFPSSWSLEDKMGKGLEVIHGPVPELNESLGRGIAALLRRLAPEAAWMRHNWGLTKVPNLNQHPCQRLPKLDAEVKEEEIWLRVEHQILTPLPESRGILFGIRVSMHPLAEVRRNAEAARLLARALESMPEEIARYKDLLKARESIIAMLV